MIPSTRRSAKVLTTCLSRSGSAFDSRETHSSRGRGLLLDSAENFARKRVGDGCNHNPMVRDRRVTSPRATRWRDNRLVGNPPNILGGAGIHQRAILQARETVGCDTCASRAMSLIDGCEDSLRAVRACSFSRFTCIFVNHMQTYSI